LGGLAGRDLHASTAPIEHPFKSFVVDQSYRPVLRIQIDLTTLATIFLTTALFMAGVILRG
jgi:hypothetical protein